MAGAPGGPGRLRGSLRSDDRLRRRREFDRVYREGRRIAGRVFLLLYRANGLDHARLGLSVPKACGGAVERNRLRRCLKELFRRDPVLRGLPYDLVFNLRREARGAAGPALAAAFQEAARRLPRRPAAPAS